MSLLNQVLQDLDERAAPPAQRPMHLADRRPQMSAAEPPPDPSSFDVWRWASWTLLAVATVAAGWVFLRPVPEPIVVAPARSMPVTQPMVPISPVPSPLPETPSGEIAVSLPSDAEMTTAVPAADDTLLDAFVDVPTAEAVGLPIAAKAPVAVEAPAEADADAAISVDRQTTDLTLLDVAPLEEDYRLSVTTTVKVIHGDGLPANERARRQIEAGELSAAEQTVLRQLADRPDDRKARELLVGLMLRGGRHTEAIDAINLGLTYHPGHRNFLLIKARLLAESGDLTRAVAVLEDRLTRGEASHEALQMLGALHQQQGHFGDAVAVYRRLVALAPTAGPAWVGLAIGLDALGDPGALEAYVRALSLGGLPEAAAGYARQRRAALESGNG